MRVMIIDIGSNTVKYDAFDLEGQNFNKIEHKSRVLGFISHIDEKGVPSDEGIKKLCDTLNEYKERAETIKCDRVLVFATASLRRCRDPYEVIDEIYKKTELSVELFNGEKEAEMSLLGVLATHPETQNGVMADMGGGSTELNIYKDRKSVYLISNPFGALSLKNSFVKDKGGELGSFANEAEIRDIYDHARKTVKEAQVPDPEGDFMFIVGGSARAIGALIAFHTGKNNDFTKDDLKTIIDEYKEMTCERHEILKALTPEREKLIIPAISAFSAIADELGIGRIKVAIGGIREGYMYSEFIGKDK